MRNNSWFSPFISAFAPKKEAVLKRVTVGISVTDSKPSKTLRVIVKDNAILDKLGDGKFAEMRAVKHGGRSYLTIRLVDVASEGRAIRYATYLQIQASSLTFLPLEAHKKKDIDAFFSEEDNALLVVLPADYRPAADLQLN